MVRNTPSTDTQWRLVAMMAAFSLLLASIEYLFPKPAPFLRLGLANIPIILTLPLLSFKKLFTLSILKVLGQALVNGTLFSYVFFFSLVGSLASFFVMLGLWMAFKEKVGALGLSVAGAAASNLVQITFSILFIFGSQSLVIAPVFLLVGLISGTVVGLISHSFVKQSIWFQSQIGKTRYAGLWGTEPKVEMKSSRQTGEADQTIDPYKWGKENILSRWGKKLNNGVSAGYLFVIAVLCLLPYMILEIWYLRLILIFFFYILAQLQGKRIKLLFFLALVLSVTFFQLFIPLGKVLISIGPFSVTEGALINGLSRGFTIIGLVFLSLALIRRDLQFPGFFGHLLGDMFLYFERISSRRWKIARSVGILKEVDNLIITWLQDEEKPAAPKNSEDRRKKSRSGNRFGPVLFYSLFPICAWGLLLLSFTL